MSPNPTKGDLMIQFNLNSTENLRYAVRDLAGRMVLEGDFGAVPTGVFNQQLNVRGLTTGMYQLEIRSDAGVKTSKFVVSE